MTDAILIKVIGGLGNQMFQFAMGRAVATKTGAKLLLDITDFENYEFHSYSLNHLSIQETYATKQEIRPFKKHQRRMGKVWIPYNILFANDKRYIKEKSYTFDAQAAAAKPPCYLDGYWQTEKYFTDIKETLHKEFAIKTPLSDFTKGASERIVAAPEPVSLHIRRGDFANNPSVSKYHGTCSPEYYDAAIQYINERISSPQYFVFSDDIEWAKTHVQTGHPTEFIGQGADRNYEDLELMRLCKHHILSNSTFGWWGAWLSRPEERKSITVAPKKWFAKDLDLSDLMPPSWIQF
jgi:hypothetical protein